MTHASPKSLTRRDELLRVALLLVLCLFLFFFRLGSRVLWDVDEGMHATVAKNIVEHDDWITPTFNGKNFYDKPILFSWFGALSFKFLGYTEFAARLPGARFGLGCILVTYFLGRVMFGPRVGFLGGVVLATSAHFIIMSRAVVHDTALALFTTLALLLFYLGFQDERRRGRWFLLFWIAAGFAVLAKGPLGLLLPFLVIGLFLLATGQIRILRSMRVGWGLLVLLVVAGPWYLAISLRNPDYLPYFLFEKNLGSVVGRFHHHPKPMTFYPGVLIGGMLPWSAYLPLALVRAWRGLSGPLRQPHLFLLLWAGTMFGFFFVMTSKRESYLLPMLPAVALLTAVPCSDLLERGSEALRRGFIRSAWVPFGFLLTVLVWVAVDPPLYAKAKVGLEVWHILAFLVPATVLLGINLGLFWLGKYRAALTSIVLLSSVGLLVFSLVITPPVGPFKATRELGLELDRRLPRGERMVMYNRMRDSALFYTGREALTLHHPTKLVELLESDRREYCIISERDLEKNRELVEGLYTVLAHVGNKYLISNRPDSVSPAARPRLE